MPTTSSGAAGTRALIGPPPATIPVLAISSFLLMALILYYVFFKFTFSYDYAGALVVRHTNPQQLVVTLPKGQNLNGDRTKRWSATIEPLQKGSGDAFTYEFEPRSGGIRNNELRIPSALMPHSLRIDAPVACKVRLTSAPLIAKLL